MTQPVWTTTPGFLGTATESTQFSVNISASGETPTYRLISGSLPPGLTLDTTSGQISGTPPPSYLTQTYEFVVRASDPIDPFLLTDRTFSITVNGTSPPQWISSSLAFSSITGEILSDNLGFTNLLTTQTSAFVVNKQYVDFQLTAKADVLPPGSNLRYYIADTDGELPNGLTLDSSGRISGIVDDINIVSYIYTDLAQYDVGGFEQNPYDYITRKSSSGYNYYDKVYQFYVTVTDSYASSRQLFQINVKDSAFLSEIVSVGGNPVEKRLPVPPQWVINRDLGILRANNRYLYPITVYDPYPGHGQLDITLNPGAPVYVTLTTSTISSSANLLIEVPPQTAWRSSLNLSITATKKYDLNSAWAPNFPSVQSTVTFVGAILAENVADLTFTTPTTLNAIRPGVVSTLSLDVQRTDGMMTTYRVVDGSLPPGLVLETDGTIVGRVAYDGSTQTVYTAIVRAEDVRRQIYTEKTVNIPVDRSIDTEFIDIFLKPFLAEPIRSQYHDLITNPDIINPNLLYRPLDPNFGIQLDPKMCLYYGIERLPLGFFASAMENYFYNKRLFAGGIKTAVARDSNNSILYELVYVDLIDQYEDENNNILSGTIEIGGKFYYPNSIDNLRRALEVITYQSRSILVDEALLPLYRQTTQNDGTSPNSLITIAPICFTRPGASSTVAANLRNSGFDFSLLNIEVNRLIVSNTIETNSDKYLIFPGTDIMSSNITTSTININFPVAGSDNNTQGFRNNFAAIARALDTASVEITALQETTTYIMSVLDAVSTSSVSTIVTDFVVATAGQTVVTFAKSYVLGGNGLEITVNGSVQIKGLNYIETTPNSVTFTSGLRGGDVVYARIFQSLQVTPFTQYSGIDTDSVTTTAGQTVVTFAKQYTMGNNSIDILVNGITQIIGVDFNETTGNTVTFTTPLNAGDVVYARILKAVTFAPSTQYSTIAANYVTASAGQTVVNVGREYSVGGNALEVSLNGAVQRVVADYVETSTTTITFTSPLAAGDIVYFRTFSAAVINNSASAVTFSDGKMVQDLRDPASGNGAAVIGASFVTGTTRTVAAAFVGECVISADATGATNVTATVQSALSSGASLVILPPGTYLVGSLTVPAGVALRGYGWNSILRLDSAINAAVITISGANCSISDLKIDGNGDNQNHSGACAGIALTNTSTSARLTNVWVDKACDWGFYVKGAGHKFDRCVSTDVRGAQDSQSVRCGFLLNDGLLGHVCKDITLTACEARDSTVAWTNGFILEDGGTAGGGLTKNITLQGCVARNNSYMGYKPKSDQTTLQGCHASNNGDHGYQTQNAPQDLVFMGCTADNNGFSGYYLNPTSSTVPMRGLIVMGCIARNNGQDVTASTRYGFAFEATAGSLCDGAVISGNTAYDTQGTVTQLRGMSFGASGSFTNVTFSNNFSKGHTVDLIAGVSLDLTTLTKSNNVGFSSAVNSLNFTWPTNIQRLEFLAENVPINAASVAMTRDGTTTRGYVMTRAGSIRGVVIKGNAAITAGTLTVLLRINGTPNGTFNVVLNSTNPTISSSETNIRVGTFVKGDVISLTYSTDAAFLPAGTTDYDGVVEVMYQ